MIALSATKLANVYVDLLEVTIPIKLITSEKYQRPQQNSEQTNKGKLNNNKQLKKIETTLAL
jgi:hypothetical protein